MPDAYTRKARIAPALLLALPGAAVLFAGALSPQAAVRAGGLFLGAVGIVVAVLIRDAGRRVQRELWLSWGGPPAQSRLRWRDGGSPVAVERLHRRVEAVTGEPLPDEPAELADPESAERQYDDAIGVLKERTRDADAFPLVAAENAEYGFRRNTFGLRPLGRVVSLIGLSASVALLLLGDGEFASRAARSGPAVAVCGLSAVLWWVVVSEDWVRRAANDYADRLFGAMELLD